MPFELRPEITRAQSSAQPPDDMPPLSVRADGQKGFVFEPVMRRLNKSVSDLDGTDPYIHRPMVRGTMGQVCNASVTPLKQTTVPQMLEMYRELRRDSGRILKKLGAHPMFTARVFSDLCLGAGCCGVNTWDQTEGIGLAAQDSRTTVSDR